MAAHPTSEALFQIVETKGFECLASLKGDRAQSRPPAVERSLLTQKLVQTIQIPSNGLRDGNLGDDEPVNSAQEGL